ncbi:peptidoglycan-binding protein [Hyphococcus sp.]|uniref:peptidoglycan-binding protein n=1 Tax=Hyphococcus sp. TaxID=2038636 RepID=UPI0035C712D8
MLRFIRSVWVNLTGRDHRSLDWESTIDGKVVTKESKKSAPPTVLDKLSRLVTFSLALTLTVSITISVSFFIGRTAGADSVVTASGYSSPVDWTRLADWTDHADHGFREERNREASGYNGKRFDQLAFGLHYWAKGAADKSYYYLTLAAMRGSVPASRYREDLVIPENEKAVMDAELVKTMIRGGREGNFLLGMLYLQNKAFSLAQHPDNLYCYYFSLEEKLKLGRSANKGLKRALPTWPPCEKNFQLNGAAQLVFPNRILPRDDEKAYLAFARASLCFHHEASLWMNAMQNAKLIDQGAAERLQKSAEQERDEGGDSFCRGDKGGGPLPGRGSQPPPPGGPVDGAGAVARQYCALDPADGFSKAQRERPGRSGYDPANDAQDAPICADGSARDPYCFDSAEALEAADEARVCLRLGDAMLSAGDVDLALQYYRASIARGRRYGAQASLVAGDRLRAITITCEYSTASLAEIARGTKGAKIIDLEHRQRALKALGYYNGAVDGKYGAMTRAGMRSFQREFGFDETGALSALETVLLICQAAETKSDRDSQNVLGIMYAAGLGVVQNTDLGLEWFERAASRGSAEAYYNLARIYGTGTILSSYRLCDIVENDDRARAYYLDAARLGHPQASSESFGEFSGRIKEETATGLELKGRSCGRARQTPPLEGQNK